MNKQFFRVWHRRIGVFSLSMMLWLAVSGSVINHGDALALNKTEINVPWLNRLYGLGQGIKIPQAFYLAGKHFYCFQGDFYVDTEVVSACESSLIAAAFLQQEIENPEGQNARQVHLVFLNKEELIVLDEQYNLFDNIDMSLFRQEFDTLWVRENTLLLQESHAENLWVLDLHSLQLTETADPLVKEHALPELSQVKLPAEISRHLSFPGINLERVLLDAHSGRLFGSLGVLVVDFFALLFVLLGISGLWIFLRKPS